MKITLSIFPKFFQHLSLPQLVEMIADVGLDTCNLVIRDGYWVSENNLATELPIFVRTMATAGFAVKFATTGYTTESLIADPSPLGILADNGIKDFRIGYFREKNGDPHSSMAEARAQLADIMPYCERYNIRAIYQVHHGTLITSSCAARQLVYGLSPKYIGIELDPGNQTFEGMENWGRAARVLGDYLVALGIKDSMITQDQTRINEPGKGWSRQWVPLDCGEINWYDVVRALRACDFAGTGVYMPFYNEDDPITMQKNLKREVAYLRQVIREVLAEEVSNVKL
ncbi:MAG: sugar phosphate isomerase/epimerase [bacterium]